MYNRYIPQPDGSFRRRTMPDSRPQKVEVCPEPPPCPPEPPCPPVRPPQRQNGQRRYQKKPSCEQNTTSDGFLRQLLPKNIDTGDLLVIALLLLMAGDCQEDKSTALLTLALYLFM